jgi:hypothetical protein
MYMRIPVVLFAFLIPIALTAQNREIRASWLVDGNVEKYENRSHTALESMEQGSSVIYATNEADLILTKLRMNKTSGSVMDDDRRETGVNSALLADNGSHVRVEDCEVTSHSSNSDGITMCGQGTIATVQEGKVTTYKSGSAGIVANHNAVITVFKTEVVTASNQSPSFYTIDNGQIDITEAFGQSAGQASPLFHSSGIMTATKCRMTSAKWTIGNVENGILTLVKNDVKAGGISGFLVYGTKSKAAYGTLILAKNSISVAEGPLFLVTNIDDANITVAGNNKISLKGKELMSVRSDDWGVKGANGGHATLTVGKQSLKGNIEVDSISSLTVNLIKKGKLDGQINKVENRCAQVNVNLAAGSSWTSKGDSYISSITFEQPLAKGLKQLKGKHTIYYDPANPANAPLEGKEYKTAGGALRPLK